MWLRPRGNPGYLIRDYRMKMTGMPVLSLRGRNYKFWSHLFRTARSEREYSTPRCRSQKRSPFNKHYTWLHICYSPVHMVVLLTNTVYWKLKNALTYLHVGSLDRIVVLFPLVPCHSLSTVLSMKVQTIQVGRKATAVPPCAFIARTAQLFPWASLSRSLVVNGSPRWPPRESPAVPSTTMVTI